MKSQIKILIANGDPTTLRVYALLVSKKMGLAEIVTCCSFATALSALNSKFDLILTHRSLDTLEAGLDFIRAAQRTQPGTPIILSTFYLAREIHLTAADFKVYSLLPVPFSPTEMCEAIRAALALPKENSSAFKSDVLST